MKEIGSVIKEILDNIGDGILFVDRDYHIVFANRTLLQICGQEEQEVIGQKCYGLYHQSSMPCQKKDPSVVCSRDEVFRTGRSVSATHTHKMQDGTEKVFDITASPIINEKGEIIQVLEILRDVTEKKRVEEVLRESEEKYRAFFEQAADSIVLIDAETGAPVEFNSKAYENLGYSRKEFQKLKIPDFEVVESAEEVTKHIKKIIKKGADVFETKHRRKDGQIRDILVSSRAISVGGKGFVQSIWSDITERKQAEEELKATIIRAGEEKAKSEAIVASIGDALGIVDTNYVIKYQNQVSKNLLGDHIGEFCYKAYKGADQICEGCPVAVSLKDGKIHKTERSWSTDKGITRLEVTASPLRDSTGKIIGGIEVVRDITERKKMEALLQEEKNKLQAVVEAMEYGLTIQDCDYNIIYQNKVLKETFGHLGEKCYRVYEGKERVCDGCPVEMVYRDGKSHTSERHITMPSGENTCWENTASPVRNSEGEIVACLEVARNITERKKVEEELKNSEEKYRGIFDESIAAVYVFDEKKNFVDSNQAGLDLLGYSKAELLNMSIPDVDADPNVVLPAHEQLLSGKKIINYEHKLKKKDGTIITVLNNSRPLIDVDGNVVGMQSTLIDVTERKKVEESLKESEKKYRDLVDNALIGVYKTHVKGNILYVNNALAKMLEFDSPEEMIRQSVLTRYKNVKDRDVLIGSLKEKGRVTNFDVEILTKTERTISVLLSAALDGDTISGMIMDVTELRRAEEAVKDSERFLSSILDGIKDAVVVIDREFKVVFANSTYCEQLGKSFNEIKGRHCYEVLYNLGEPCYSEEELECIVKQVFETGLSSRDVRKKFDKHIEITVYPLKDSSGKVRLVVEIRRDVTKNVQLDEELKIRIKELEEFYDMSVGRELKMIELKEEIEKLNEELK